MPPDGLDFSTSISLLSTVEVHDSGRQDHQDHHQDHHHTQLEDPTSSASTAPNSPHPDPSKVLVLGQVDFRLGRIGAIVPDQIESGSSSMENQCQGLGSLSLSFQFLSTRHLSMVPGLSVLIFLHQSLLVSTNHFSYNFTV